MLLLEADICFYTLEESPKSLTSDINPKLILRPDIDIGGYLSSGTIIVDKNIDMLIRGKTYRVLIEMPLIFGESYEVIKNKLKKGDTFNINNASRIIGTGKIINFIYEI